MPWRLQEILYFFSIALQYKCFIYRDSFWKQLQFLCSFIIKNLALQYRQFIKYFHWQCYRFFVIEQEAKTKRPWQLPDFQRPSQSKTITIEFSLQKRSDLRVNKIHESFQLRRFESQQNYTQFYLEISTKYRSWLFNKIKYIFRFPLHVWQNRTWYSTRYL